MADEEKNSPFASTSFLIMKGTSLFLLVSWTIVANFLVFVVLYKNPKLRTVPNLLVANLAFSDFMLALLVLPLSAVYTVTSSWIFGKTLCELWLSFDILVCTASIWNLSMIGLDRYWAITKPVDYMNKRNVRFASYMIASVWILAAMISIAPFVGWKAFSQEGNYVPEDINTTHIFHCVHFQDLPSFTIYSATGSFFIPLLVMFYVYFKIYRAFLDHQKRQMYRHQVIRQHLESTILHDLSLVKGGDELDDEEDSEGDVSNDFSSEGERMFEPEDLDETQEFLHESQRNYEAIDLVPYSPPNPAQVTNQHQTAVVLINPPEKGPHEKDTNEDHGSIAKVLTPLPSKEVRRNSRILEKGLIFDEPQITPEPLLLNGSIYGAKPPTRTIPPKNILKRASEDRNTPPGGKKQVMMHLTEEDRKRKTSESHRDSVAEGKGAKVPHKPEAISAAKEKRGVKVLGIILGCFTLCWFPFFVMYLTATFCDTCPINAHVEQFITWLGYANSAMNPIIYTVFNRDYQMALRRLLERQRKLH